MQMALHLCRSFSGSAAVLGLRTSTSAVQHAAYHPNGCMVQQRALATASSCFPSLSSPFTLDTTHHLSNHVAAGSRAAPPLPGSHIGARFQSSVRHIHTSSTAALPAASTSKNPWVLGGGVEVDGAPQCPGCGAELQSEVSSGPGFIAADKLDRFVHNIDQWLKARTHVAAPRQAYLGGAALDEGSKSTGAGGGDAVAGGEGSGEGSGELVVDDGLAAALRATDQHDHDHAAAADAGAAASPPPPPPPQPRGSMLRPKPVVCARCHTLSNYGTARAVNIPEDSVFAELAPLRAPENPGLAICIVDITDFPGSLVPNLNGVIGEDTGIMLVANKVDLLPSDTRRNQQRLMEWLRHEAAAAGVRNVEKVVLVSASTSWGLRGLLRRIAESCASQSKDAYFVGATNVGKSSLINRLLDAGGGPKITTSPTPGTTLSNLKFIVKVGAGGISVVRGSDETNSDVTGSEYIPTRKGRKAAARAVGGGSGGGKRKKARWNPRTRQKEDMDRVETVSLFDTPGVMVKSHLSHDLTEEELLAVQPARQLLPQTIRMYPGQSLLLGGLSRLDYTAGPEHPVFITVFASNKLHLHVTKTLKADDIYAQHAADGFLVPPYPDGGMRKKQQTIDAITATENNNANSPTSATPAAVAAAAASKVEAMKATTRRMDLFPPMLEGEPVDVVGAGIRYGAVDVAFPGIGWCMVTLGKNVRATLVPHTPEGRQAATIRSPIEPTLVRKMGQRRGGTQRYDQRS